MRANVYQFVGNDGRTPVKEWLDALESQERARMNQKIDMLKLNGGDLPPKLLSSTSHRQLSKIRLNGRVAPRLFLCRGPITMDGTEYTLLAGAMEKGWKLYPGDVADVAIARREEIIADDHNRRKLYVRT